MGDFLYNFVIDVNRIGNIIGTNVSFDQCVCTYVRTCASVWVRVRVFSYDLDFPDFVLVCIHFSSQYLLVNRAFFL